MLPGIVVQSDLYLRLGGYPSYCIEDEFRYPRTQVPTYPRPHTQERVALVASTETPCRRGPGRVLWPPHAVGMRRH